MDNTPVKSWSLLRILPDWGWHRMFPASSLASTNGRSSSLITYLHSYMKQKHLIKSASMSAERVVPHALQPSECDPASCG
jgi:hypothetical protein